MEKEKTFRPSLETQIMFGIVCVGFFCLAVYAYIFESLDLRYPLIAGAALTVFQD